MTTRKTIHRSVKSFIQAIHQSTKIQFRSKELEAEVILMNRRTQEESLKIVYKWNGVKFSFFESPLVVDIINDFQYQCRVFGIS